MNATQNYAYLQRSGSAILRLAVYRYVVAVVNMKRASGGGGGRCKKGKGGREWKGEMREK